MMPRRLLQVNTTASVGAVGRIVTMVDRQAAQQGAATAIAYSGAYPAPDRADIGASTRLIAVGGMGNRVRHALASRLSDSQGLHSRRATLRLIDEIERFAPTEVCLHNLHGYYLHYPTLLRWLANARDIDITLTLHDLWPLTGHCVHFVKAGCMRYNERGGCHDCPLINTYPASWFVDRSSRNFELKKDLLTSLPTDRTTIVCVSRYVESVVAQSFMAGYRRRVEYSCVDGRYFNPGQRERVPEDVAFDGSARAGGGVPVVLGVAYKWTDRKGLGDMVRLRRELPSHWRMALVGIDKSPARGIEALGHVATARAMADIYRSSSVLVCPSYEESYGMTKLEALACGTPVVAYDCTGASELAPDAALPEALQYVAPGDIKALAAAVCRSAETVMPPRSVSYIVRHLVG